MRIAPPRLMSGLLSRPRAISPELIAALVALVFVLIKLHVPAFVGLADNGDNARLMQPLGLTDLTTTYNIRFDTYVNQFYAIGARGPILYPSSALAVLWVAAHLSAIFQHGIFDLAVAGAIYTLLFAGGVYLVVRGVRRLWDRPWLTWTVAVALLVIGTDDAFIAYFHSLYSEPASYVTLLLMLGALLNLLADERLSVPMLAIFTLAAVGFFTAKNQDLPLVLFLLPVGARLAWRSPEWRQRGLVALSFVLVVGAGTFALVRTPASYEQTNTYDSVFVGILHGDTPAQAARDLTTLGVDPRYADLAGHPFYDHTGLAIQQDSAFVSDFYGHVTKTTVVKYYLGHPAKLIAGLGLTADAAMALRPDYLGNYLPDSGMPPRAQSHTLDLWSWLTQEAFPRSLWVLALFYLAYFAGVSWAWWRAKTPRDRALSEFAGAIGLMALLQFVIPFLVEGTYELVKHLYLYDALFALTLMIAALWLAPRLVALVRRLLGARSSSAPATAPAAPTATERDPGVTPTTPTATPVRADSHWLMPFRARAVTRGS